MESKEDLIKRFVELQDAAAKKRDGILTKFGKKFPHESRFLFDSEEDWAGSGTK